MSDVTIKYKGNTIAALDDSTTWVLKTAGKLCDANIAIQYEKPSGSGGDELIFTDCALALDGISYTTDPVFGNVSFNYKANNVSSDTTLTTSLVTNVGDLVIATFVIRSDTYTLSSGWTELGISNVVGTSNQRTGLAYKIATSTTESLTVTQSTSARIYVNLVSIYGASIDTFGGFITQETGTSITVTRPSGLVVWGVSATLWSSGNWIVSNIDDTIVIQDLSTTQPRCLTVLDQSNDASITFTANGDGDLALAVGYVTLTGISNFYGG